MTDGHTSENEVEHLVVLAQGYLLLSYQTLIQYSHISYYNSLGKQSISLIIDKAQSYHILRNSCYCVSSHRYPLLLLFFFLHNHITYLCQNPTFSLFNLGTNFYHSGDILAYLQASTFLQNAFGVPKKMNQEKTMRQI